MTRIPETPPVYICPHTGRAYTDPAEHQRWLAQREFARLIRRAAQGKGALRA